MITAKKISVGDTVVVSWGRIERTGKVIKIRNPNHPSPGGLVVENADSIFFVAPWEHVTKLSNGEAARTV